MACRRCAPQIHFRGARSRDGVDPAYHQHLYRLERFGPKSWARATGSHLRKRAATLRPGKGRARFDAIVSSNYMGPNLHADAAAVDLPDWPDCSFARELVLQAPSANRVRDVRLRNDTDEPALIFDEQPADFLI